MELSDNEEGYEVNDSGEFVQSNGTNPRMSSSDLQDSLDSPSGRRVVIHRSGSVTVTNSAGAQLSRIESNASSEHKEIAAQYYDSQAPPPSQVALTATSRLSKKIQTQAGQLLQLQTELDEKTRYARLCEKRLLDFDPKHSFPVTQGMLGIVPPRSARTGGRDTAAQLDLQTAYETLQKQHTVAQKKLADLKKEVAQARQTAPVREKTMAAQARKIEQMARRINELESFARTDRTGGSTFRKSALEDREATELKSKNSVLSHTLRGEARLNEEQRVYVATLEAALKVKAGELGLEGHAELLAELSRLRGEVEARHRESQRYAASISALEAEMDEIRERESAARLREHEQLERTRSLSAKLATFNNADQDLQETVKSLETEKIALLDYVEDNVTRTAALSKQLEAVSAEREFLQQNSAVVDAAHEEQMQSMRDKEAALVAEIDAVKTECASLLKQKEATEDRLAQEVEKSKELGSRLTGESEEMMEMQEIQNELLNTIREKSTTVEQLRADITALKKEMNALSAERTSLQKELSMTTLKMESRHEQATLDMEAAKTQLSEELESATDECATLRAELEGLSQRCLGLENDLSIAQNRANGSEENVRTLEIERARQEKVILELSAERDKVEKVMVSINKSLEEATEELSVLRSFKALGDRIERELKDLKNEDNGRADGANTDDDALQRFGHWSSSPALQQMAPELSKYIRDQYAQFRDTQVSLREAKVHLDMEVKEKTLGSRLLHDEIHSLRSGQEAVVHARQEAEREASSARSRAEGLERELRDASSQIDALSNEVNLLQNDLDTTRTALYNAEQQSTNKQERLLATEKALSSSTRERDGVQAILNKTGKQLEKAMADLAENKAGNENLSARVDDLQQQVVDAAEDAKTLTSERRRETQMYLEKIGSLETENASLKQHNDNMKDKLNRATEDGQDLDVRLNSERAAREKYESLYSQLEEEHRNQESSVSNARSAMENALSSAETKISGLEAQVHNLEGRLQRSSSEKSVMESSIVALTSEVESIRRTLSQSIDEVCSKHGSSHPGIADFIKRRAEKLATPSRVYFNTPSKSARWTAGSSLMVPPSPSLSIRNPAVEGVRETVRNHLSLLQMSVAYGVSAEQRLQSDESELEQLRSSREQVHRLEGEVQTLRMQAERLSAAENRVRSNESELTALRDERAAETQLLRQEITYLRQQSAQSQSMEQELKRSEMERASLTERCNQLQILVDRLRSEKANANDSLSSVDAKVHSLQKSLGVAESELIQCRSDLASTRSQAQQSERRAADLDQRRKMLEQQLDSAQKTVAEQRNQIQQLQRAQSQMESEITSTLNTLQTDYQRSIQEKDRVANANRHNEQELEAANIKIRSLESLRTQLESQHQQICREKEDAHADIRRSESQQELLNDKLRNLERDRDALSSDLQSVQTEASTLRNQVQELRQREFHHEQEINQMRLENSRLHEAKLDLARQLDRSRKNWDDQKHLEEAQIHLLQSKVGGLESTLSSYDNQTAQKDLAIMELSQSIRRVESAISPPRPGNNYNITQTPGATPLPGVSSNSFANNYVSSASAKLASMRRGGTTNGPLPGSSQFRIHRTGSVTLPMSAVADQTATSGVSSLQDRLKNVQETFAMLRSSSRAPMTGE